MEIVDTAKRSGAVVRGPVPLAHEDRALQRAPLAAREQDVARPVRNPDAFASDGHHRPTDKTVDQLMKLDLPAGVDVEIKLQ
jgi:small subunit ribosomal protein S10